jgi:hypothetical protein
MRKYYEHFRPYLSQILKILSGLGLGAFTIFQCSQMEYQRTSGKTILRGFITRGDYKTTSEAGTSYNIDLCFAAYPDNCFSINSRKFPNSKNLLRGDSVEIEYFTDALKRELAGQSFTEWIFFGPAEIISIRYKGEIFSNIDNPNEPRDRILLIAFLYFLVCATLVITGYMSVSDKLMMVENNIHKDNEREMNS